ncbi:hypothetical protein QGX11_gp087 [Pseudomonas phage PPSC2]|uniref:Uncharacterized protein n=1 Tax=Pseudomonas phage PPSC2 TaxID=2041350 RepID=A0A2R2YAX5_9CAUD|nr:hypothetical protein QGX11_gp087 [Pseudomonas phage PPSC2]ATN92850.1 hypothetical protein PPSC2_87 [Pseudomonas phage PPSC2]
MKNVESLIKVAEWLEDGAKHVELDSGHKLDGFDIEHSITSYGDCGTACCIAGALVQFQNLVKLEQAVSNQTDFFDTEGEEGEVVEGVMTLAKNHLGIEHTDAEKLFLPWDHFGSETFHEFSDPDRAAKVIRHYIETGAVNWDLFEPSPKFCEDNE